MGIYWTRVLAFALLFAAFQGRVPMLSAGQGKDSADTEKGVVTTLAGSPGSGGDMDGTGSQTLFASPKAMSTDRQGNVYTVDNFCGTIRRITPEGTVTTIAGPENGCAFGSTDGTGSEARFNSPSGTTVDSKGNVYVADSGNCTLRKITPAGVVTTVAGSPSVCVAVDGLRSVARFNGLAGVAAGPADDIYVTSWQDCTVRRVTQDGEVTTIAGLSAVCASVDGVGSKARFGNPSGISRDSGGNFYVADETGCTIRKMNLHGEVTTLAGDPGVCGAADGVRGGARFNINLPGPRSTMQATFTPPII